MTDKMLGAVVVEHAYDINDDRIHLLLQLLNGERIKVTVETYVLESADNG